MQQLQHASDPVVCAGHVLEAVLDVMLLVREQTARRQAAKGDGVTLIHIRALGVLRKRPGATLSALSQQLALTLSATSRLVECLVSKGLVERAIPAGNRRTVSLHLTRLGTAIHKASKGQAERELATSLKSLSPAQRAELSLCMQQLSTVLEGAA